MIDHLAQAVAEQDSGCDWRLSVSGKPDVVFEVVERDAAEGLRLLEAGAVNRQVPFMPNAAASAPGHVDTVVTDLTADERHSVTALQRLTHATRHPVELVPMALNRLGAGRQAPPACGQRLGLGLDETASFKAMCIRKLFAGNP